MSEVLSSGVALRNVSRTFGDRRVLSDIDLEIEEGEFLVIVGASGCGKSTLLKIIAGLDRGAEGEVHIEENRSIVFQDARLLPWKLVWENVVLGLRGDRREFASARWPPWTRSTCCRAPTPGR